MTKSHIRTLINEVISETLNEGISISIQGHNYDEDITDLYDLANWLASKVQYPIMKKMGEEEKKTIKHDVIVPDKADNAINVYTGHFPEKWRPMLLGGIDYFLKSRGIKTGKWTSGVSNMYSVEKISIPIGDIDTTSDPAPEFHLSYSTWTSIKNILGLPGLNAGEYTFFAPVDTILEKVNKFYELYDIDVLDQHILDYIITLEKMAKWAKDHGYDTISGG